MLLKKKWIKLQLWFWGNINKLKKRFFYKPSAYKSPEWEDMEEAVEQYKALKKKEEEN